jgi:hypothetical protein
MLMSGFIQTGEPYRIRTVKSKGSDQLSIEVACGIRVFRLYKE